MRRTDFHFDLPDSQIAQMPTPVRGASRLLYLDGAHNELRDLQFARLPGLLRAGDLLVFNDTRVIPARLLGQKESGGKVEVLVERILDEHRVAAHVRASKSPKPGNALILEGQVTVEVLGRLGELFELRFPEPVLPTLKKVGRLPLPPYIERTPDADDSERYQTVYAKREGAVAAPTAGLHFTDAMLEQLKTSGIEMAYVTLHVGAGTFQPVRADELREHVMHSEWLDVPQETCEAIARTRARGGRVVAVGTTVVRSLESAAREGDVHGGTNVAGAGMRRSDELRPFSGETDIFIYPGYKFRVVDALVTNFHLPESTLLMLVCAFAGYEEVMAAYRHAVAEGYRFFSYGDAMFLLPKGSAVRG